MLRKNQSCSKSEKRIRLRAPAHGAQPASVACSLVCRAGAIALFLFAIPVDAQDVIVLNTDDGKTTKRNGQIESWIGNQIILKTKSRTRKINDDRVVEVLTAWPPELNEARKLMSGGKYVEALPKLKSAREQDNRKWAQQVITAELVQCLDAVDQTEAAAIEFLKLYQHDSQTRFFHLIPLPWLMNQPYPEEGKFGAKMIQSKNSLLALIGCSMMLTSSQRQNAKRRLEQLANDSDSRIAQLATTQLWRTEVLSADENTVARWQRQTSRLPDKLRAGPLVLLAQAQSRLGESDSATTTFMKLPILYPEKKSLAALALYRSGEILQDKGQEKLASSLHQELYRNYPSSQFAERARQK